MKIRRAQPSDVPEWGELRRELWPGAEDADPDVPRFAGFLAFDDANGAIGFAEVTVRDVAEGYWDGPVGYLEGWYVRESARRQGVGRALVNACEEWVRAQGISHFASDAEVENELSAKAHARLGFEDVGVLRHFLKKLD